MVILIVAEIIYMLAGYLYRNPAMSSIYIWVLLAIKDKQVALDDIQSTTGVLLVVHASYVIGLTAWLLLDKMNNAPNEKTGLFY